MVIWLPSRDGGPGWASLSLFALLNYERWLKFFSSQRTVKKTCGRRTGRSPRAMHKGVTADHPGPLAEDGRGCGQIGRPVFREA